ncbi:hypothetical protein LuPra_04072 [Luteitalea pratensis]|uniref:Uncharacterized protein n=1 Tax=Luteitalea pratensis TaxID=1855912 RepID=A0A143PSL4_LUTPR|nr:hypothetical protein [Luteitalea pratensis]AMY10829.1 hypothetical protein LuPra_04072 [Luteitalea pratensis]
MPIAVPAWFDDVDITDWADVQPEELLEKRREHVDRHAAARAFKYSRATASLLYDEIGFRWTAAVPVRGEVPLQTIDSARLRHTEAARQSCDLYDLHAAEQERLGHRPLDLPPNAGFTWQRRGKLIDFIANEDGEAVRRGEVWRFPVSALPSGLMAGADVSDSPRLPTQRGRANVPGVHWLPFLELLEAGYFKRMQQWRGRLVDVTAPGCFYCFVSHRWLAVTEPDPEGRQAAFLAWQMFAHLCEAVRVARIRGLQSPRKFIAQMSTPVGPSGSSLAEALLVNVLRPAGRDGLIEQAWHEALVEEHLIAAYATATADQDVGLTKLSNLLRKRPALRSLCERVFLWYDYSCLPQPPRSADDERFFRRALPHLPSIQLLGRTAILLDDAEDYLSRAWCALEAVVADPGDTTDLLVGSKRTNLRSGSVELHFENLLLDRPHIQWRAVLDTEVFRVQRPEQCMARLNLSATDPTDIALIYESLRRLSAPRKIHSDAMEVVTGVVPLPVTEHRRVLVPRVSRDSVKMTGKARWSLNWTGALELESCWGPDDDAMSITPFLPLHGAVPAQDRRPRCHVVVIAACEGEAVLLSNWVRAKRGELEELLGSVLQSLSWLATDVAPVGHFVQGTLQAVAVDCPQWIVVASEARFISCNVTAIILALLCRAKARCFAFAIDAHEDNVAELELAGTGQPSDGGDIELFGVTFPRHAGGLLRSSLVEYLVAERPAGQDADSPDAPATG